MRSDHLLKFNNELAKARSIEKLQDVLADYLKQFDINTYAFTYYSYYPNSLNKLKIAFSSANYSIWQQHYIAEGYEEKDSTLEEAYQSTLPIFWDLKTQLAAAKTPREKQMREDSITYGVEKGISIPIHGPQEDFAILLLLQMRGQKCLEAKELQFELFTAAYYFYHYIQNILLVSQKEHPIEKLSSREIQCLTLLAKQYSLKAIAEKLQITERTVNYHIQRLNRKLGTQNKYQSVIKALKKGLLKF